MIRDFLQHPLTRDLDLDDPATTALRKQIIHEKRFLFRIYDEWYRLLAANVPAGPGRLLELGSGAGFLRDYLPEVITSEIFATPDIALRLDAQALPFDNSALRAILMVDVLHHLPRVRQFFSEASRCLHPGGAILMIEPWNTPFSRLIYRNLHHEPFEPAATAWEFPQTGPLSGANGALPWIALHRDREQFHHEFPQLRIEHLRPFMPFRYLVSGGVSMRSLQPSFAFPAWRLLETIVSPLRNQLSMFAFIVLRRVSSND